MNSNSVDLIYLDPPFNSNADYAAPIGSQAAGAAFKDTWGLDDINLAWHGEIKHEQPGLYDLLNATRRIHGDSMMSYLIYMAIRVMEMRRLMSPTGSLYLHCDPTASHYLKLMLDDVFGSQQFQNEFIWHYGGGGASKKRWARKHDVILFYTAGSSWTFNADDVRTPHKWTDGQRRADGSQRDERGKLGEDVWQHHGVMPWAKERVGYPTQKPLALLERIVKASSKPGDVVLDPFCGCATACIAATLSGRQWVGIDISPKAAELVAMRMHDEVGVLYDGLHRTDIPERTDLGKLPAYNCTKNKKWLYGEQGGYCNGCSTHFKIQNLTVDHIIARAKGGTDHLSNLQLLCGHCNSVKGDKPMEYLLACLTDKGWIKRQFAEAV
ncbi:DNA methyltransferase [Candidatus Poriferisodalis sp.]|uniref:DNA methyltransferase n=1 Tax=Candidatus Poriferisodalis sp. TaxID=3101277 RepID=UPI003B02607C